MRHLVWLMAVCAFGQGLKLDGLDKLAAKASETANVTLDGPLLAMAVKFLSGKDKDEQEVKKLVTGLKGIYVRHFEFKEAGAYTETDVDDIRNQLRAPEWKIIIKVREKTETSEIYVRYDGDKVAGLTVISAEPKELTIVNIMGPVDLDNLAELGGNFGIPHIGNKKTTKPKSGKDEE